MGTCKNCRPENCHSEAFRRRIRLSRSRKLGLAAGLALIIACLAAPAAAATGKLGRLFFTPQQRQDLDRRRASNRTGEDAPQIKKGPLTLDGRVQRSSGKTATWINGMPQYDSDGSRDPARITVVPNAGEPGVSLKVGQTYERSSGTVRDGLQGGKITVGKPSFKAAPSAPAAAARR